MARKLAKVASANKMAKEILNASAPVLHASASHASASHASASHASASHASASHASDQKKYKIKIAALQEELEDANSSLEAKRALISNLHTEVRELESENRLLKQNLTPFTLVSPGI